MLLWKYNKANINTWHQGSGQWVIGHPWTQLEAAPIEHKLPWKDADNVEPKRQLEPMDLAIKVLMMTVFMMNDDITSITFIVWLETEW